MPPLPIQLAFDLALKHHQAGQLPEAEKLYRHILAHEPQHADATYLLGLLANQVGQDDAALELFRRAIAINPNHADALCDLGNALQTKGQFDEAATAYRRAIAARPNYPTAQHNLGNALTEIGQLDDAITAYRCAIALKPGYRKAHSNLIYALYYHPDSDTNSIAEELARWNAKYAEPLRHLITAHPNDPNPDRRLRIGYVSPDLKNHPVGRNLLLLFQNHDRQQFEFYCYSDVANPDAITARLKASAEQWREISGISDAQVAQQIREDQIDVLIDSTVHTGENRLTLFALKPAPVQASYFFSAGISAIEYRLTDRYLDPPEKDDPAPGEQAVRLPHCFWCSEPIEASVPVNPLPALSTGHITFACFNNFNKINSYILGIWIEVLQNVSASRLILNYPLGDCRNEIGKKFKASGIDPNRVEFVGKVSRQIYFERYNRVDICLDPAPFPGHTTSLDILWMGVPFVTLAGKTSVSRGGVSVLSNVGLTELIAHIPEEYISIATKLAGDLPKLADLRASLRQRALASPLFDAKGHARDMEAAYRLMWRNWCEAAALHT